MCRHLLLRASAWLFALVYGKQMSTTACLPFAVNKTYYASLTTRHTTVIGYVIYYLIVDAEMRRIRLHKQL